MAQSSPLTALAASVPRQALLLAAWAGAWEGLQRALEVPALARHPLTAPALALLALLLILAALWSRTGLYALVTAVPFAVTQVSALTLALVTAHVLGAPAPFRHLGPSALLALITASMLAVAWKRRPYPWSRVGFLLVHVAPAPILAGQLWARGNPGGAPALLSAAGCALLLLGCAWMFYLKAPLKRREAAGKERP